MKLLPGSIEALCVYELYARLGFKLSELALAAHTPVGFVVVVSRGGKRFEHRISSRFSWTEVMETLAEWDVTKEPWRSHWAKSGLPERGAETVMNLIDAGFEMKGGFQV